MDDGQLPDQCAVCLAQSQDGKAVHSGSGCDLSELIKRRLESVASTGSSASSGFIEDKSYCDSEEEEEGSGLSVFLPPTPTPSNTSSPAHLRPTLPSMPLCRFSSSPLYLMKSFLSDS